jgi:hypothetical protein
MQPCDSVSSLIKGTKWVEYLQSPPLMRLEKYGSKLIAVRSLD